MRNHHKNRKVESLESREMLAADISLDNGVLEIEGTDDRDVIEIREYQVLGRNLIEATVYEDDGAIDERMVFSASSVRRILVNADDGDDTVRNQTRIESIINGGDGDDVLSGGSSHDRIDGGAGNDRISGRNGNDRLIGRDGNDRISGGNGNDSIFGGNGNDHIYGSNDNDFIRGNNGNDFVHGGRGDDRMYGDDGEDRMYGSSGDDTVSGGNHDDYLSGGSGSDRIFGGNHNDRMYGNSGNDRIQGSHGDDVLSGGTGDDLMFGQNGDDRMQGDQGNDSMVGGSGNDQMFGNDGDDSLWGSNGDDVIRGDAGNDRLIGSDGNDSLFGGRGNDRYWGSEGMDRFLTYNGDAVNDKQDEDARVHFEDAEEYTYGWHGEFDYTAAAHAWADAEVEVIDEALNDLFDASGNNELLKKAPTDSNGIARNETQREWKFYRNGNRVKSTDDSLNTGNGAVNSSGDIRVFGEIFNDNDWIIRVVYHEIAHNWDQQNENGLINDYRAISKWTEFDSDPGAGWEKSSSSNSTWGNWYFEDIDTGLDGFAKTYGKKNPKEDFATAFEAWMSAEYGRGSESADDLRARLSSGDPDNPGRFEIIEQFVDSL